MSLCIYQIFAFKKICFWENHHTLSQSNLAQSIPTRTLKTILEAWNKYHDIILDENSWDVTTFITLVTLTRSSAESETMWTTHFCEMTLLMVHFGTPLSFSACVHPTSPSFPTSLYLVWYWWTLLTSASQTLLSSYAMTCLLHAICDFSTQQGITSHNRT